MDVPEGTATVVSIEADASGRNLSVHLDDGRTLEIAAEAMEARGITPGLVLDGPTLRGLEAAAERKSIARRVFSWLERRPRCRQDLRQRLLTRGHPPDAVDAVLDAFEAQGLIDDRAYARQWSEERLRHRPAGRRWLIAQLRRQGVRGEDAELGVDAAMGTRSELEMARDALRRRRFDLAEQRDRERAMRFLTRRGFATAVARTAVLDAPTEGADVDD